MIRKKIFEGEGELRGVIAENLHEGYISQEIDRF